MREILIAVAMHTNDCIASLATQYQLVLLLLIHQQQQGIQEGKSLYIASLQKQQRNQLVNYNKNINCKYNTNNTQQNKNTIQDKTKIKYKTNKVVNILFLNTDLLAMLIKALHLAL